MAAVIANLAAGVSGEGAPKLLVGTGSDQRHLIVVATSDRGLAGGFNSSIVRAARERIDELLAEGKDVRVLTVGRKAPRPAAAPRRRPLVATFEAGGNPSLAVAEAGRRRRSASCSRPATSTSSPCSSRSSSRWSPRRRPPSQLIPAEVAAGARPIDLKGAVYEYEPDEETILAELLPRNITTQVFSAMLENQAGFFAAQMTAMDNATRNAGDMIASLTLQYNRSRQAQITKELIEIISGAEAL